MTLNTEELWCWNKDCPDYGVKGKGNIVPKEHSGKHGNVLYRCRTCGHSFSETRGTPFFGLNTPREEVLRVLAMLPEKGSIRGLARATGHKQDTIAKWMKLAGEHVDELNEYFTHDLQLNAVEVDEIWAFIKKRTKMSNRAKRV
jgi:transposase-like protein